MCAPVHRRCCAGGGRRWPSPRSLGAALASPPVDRRRRSPPRRSSPGVAEPDRRPLAVAVEPRDAADADPARVPAVDRRPAGVVLLGAGRRWSSSVVAVLVVVLRARAAPARRACRRSGPGATAPRRSRRGEVVAALDAGLVELDDADADPRRAVIACWVRLEQAAAAAGTPRAAGDTSTDLVGCALLRRRTGSSADVLDRVRRTSTGRPGTPPTRSTSACATRPGPPCAGCATS